MYKLIGVFMSLMMLAACGGSTPKTLPPITSSQTWVAPATIASIAVLTGSGGTGSPAVPWDGTHSLLVVTSYYLDGSYVRASFSDTTYASGRAPSNYCSPMEPHTEVGGAANQKQLCYYYSDNESSATTGAATTGFGKTFAGGTGGTATPATFLDVPVSPGGSYPLVVPPGGSITITYYE